MALLFNRVVAVTFGPVGGVGRKFTDLHVKFTIEKGSESNANPGKILIYNLSPVSRALIEKSGKSEKLKPFKITVDAGYGKIPRRIFVGDVVRSKSEKKGPDWVTEIEAGDGEAALNQSVLDMSFKAGTPATTVVQSLVGAMGLVPGPQIGIQPTPYNHGKVVSGKCKDELDSILAEQQLEWSVQDEKVVIVPKKTPTTEIAVIMNSLTGMVGSPVRREEGIEFTSLLNPDLKPGRAVVLTSINITGTFKVRKVTHIGDTRDGDWISKCEALEVGK